MNKLTIIGNLCRDPELRTTTSGISVCSFTVAVNRRQSAQQRQAGQEQEADYFRVTAWRERGEFCGKFLQKGRKVCVVGAVKIGTYEGQDGKTHANLEVTADEVEIVSPRVSDGPVPEEPQERTDAQTGYQHVDTEELPF